MDLSNTSSTTLLRAALLGAGALVGVGTVASKLIQHKTASKRERQETREHTSDTTDNQEEQKASFSLLDGVGAIENVSYRLSDASIVVLPSSRSVAYRLLGDEAASLHESKTDNSFGKVGEVTKEPHPESQHGPLTRRLEDGQLVSVSVGSSGSVIEMIPLMYGLADKSLPCVVHAFAGKVKSDLSYELNYSDVLSARSTGFAFIASGSVAEAQDMALIAHVATARTKVPFLHSFDSAYTGRTDVELLSTDKIDSVSSSLRHSKQDESEQTDEKESEDKSTDEGLFLRSGAAKASNFNIAGTITTVMKELTATLGGREYGLFEYEGSMKPTKVMIAMASAAVEPLKQALPADMGLLVVRVFRPWSEEHLLAVLPETTTKIAVLEHAEGEVDEWGPLFLDVTSSVQGRTEPPTVSTIRYGGNFLTAKMAKEAFHQLAVATAPCVTLNLEHESSFVAPRPTGNSVHTFRPEASYIKILKQVLGNRLLLSNAVSASSIWGSSDVEGELGNLEYGFGVLLAMQQRRDQLVNAISSVVAAEDQGCSGKLRDALQDWLATRGDLKKNKAAATKALDLLNQEQKTGDSTLEACRASAELFHKHSPWLVGGSNWASDLSLSGLHHVIASQKDVNVLVLDTEVYSEATRNKDGSNWKKDIGLYAMSYGGVYVASVSEYASYTQVLHAMMEADAFPGPSIVLAYAPEVEGAGTQGGVLSMLKESKLAVDTGKFPLYRWNPAKNDTPFTLDSQYIQQQLKNFLKMDNQLSLLANEVPAINTALAGSLDQEVQKKHETLKKEAVSNYMDLMKGLSNCEPVLFLYGSDGGNAESVARRLHKEATKRGLDSKCMVADDCPVADMKEEPNVVVVLSTAGQGEFPANSKQWWAALGTETGPGWLPDTKYSVFAMGDRHYWPRKGDEIYFAKSGKDVDAKLAEIGATRLTEIGIGDDQDDDGYETGLGKWAPLLWDALGVGGAGTMEAEVKIDDDQLKKDSNFLRGTILEGLADESTGALAATDTKLTKFHGIYQQDDRDIRDSRRQQGLEKAYSFMIRVGLPGGRCTPEQYLVMDDLGRDYGNGGLKLTTRQAFQLHCVTKKKLKNTMQIFNRALMTSLAACGDVNRNIMSTPLPDCSVSVYTKIQKFADDLTKHLFPRTSAYHEIWMDKKRVAGHVDVEPIYGPTYLPRKFKIAISVPPYNDCDIFAHCLGIIAILEEGKLLGFNISVGGGMGMTHGNKKTYPQIGQLLGFCTYEQAIAVAEAIITTQRDRGDRKNRKHARLKYTVEDMGLDNFRKEVESRCGFKIEPARPFKFTSNGDRLGWNQTDDKLWHYGMFIENGRIKDKAGYPLKTGLREVALDHKGTFRLSPNGNLFISDVKASDRKNIDDILARHKIGNHEHTRLRTSSMACAALPMCALSFAEAERYQPTLIAKFEDALIENGLKDESITMRMTGCPNGCARPYIAEIGFVGKAPGTYNMYLGASHAGDRLSKLYKENLKEEQILNELRPMLANYSKTRDNGEKFGDWCIRTGIVKATVRGADFHENLGDV